MKKEQFAKNPRQFSTSSDLLYLPSDQAEKLRTPQPSGLRDSEIGRKAALPTSQSPFPKPLEATSHLAPFRFNDAS